MKVFAKLALYVALPVVMSGCGRKGALIYPDMLVPEAPNALEARQSGASVRLAFALPEKNRAGGVMPHISGIKISRRVLDAHEEVCRSCTTGYQLLQRLYADSLPPSVQRRGSRLVLIDEDVKSGFSYSYNLVPFMADGVEGAVAEIKNVVVAPPLAGPTVAVESTPTDIRVRITATESPAWQLVGYNIYRITAEQAQRSFLPVNREPLAGGEYQDALVERGIMYRYQVRMVMRGTDGHLVETLPSPEVSGALKEDE